MKYAIFFLIQFIICFPQLKAQQNQLTQKADSLYTAGNYKAAAPAYVTAADSSKGKPTKASCIYNAACCFALTGDTAKAVTLLDKAVYEYGYKNPALLNDADLTSLHQTSNWKKIVNYLDEWKKKLSDPLQAKLITTDIHHFWDAFDAAWKDTMNMQKIFQEKYFDVATIGLEDYTATKIGSIEKFVSNQKSKPKFYKAIRKNTLSIDDMKEEIYKTFFKFKELYADAVFPDIYFVIGRWNSAGTVSSNGLLLGVDQIAKSDDIPQDELSLWAKNNFSEIKKLPVIVAHELIHSQQDHLKQDTTVLFYAIQEGMADFFAEMLTGVNPSQRQQDFAKDKKKKIWQDFEKEMYLNRYHNWIANGDQERPDHPADLGYYIGYEICKAYYDEMPDKKQAIIDIFHINNYKDFLQKSKYAEKMKQLPD